MTRCMHINCTWLTVVIGAGVALGIEDKNIS